MWDTKTFLMKTLITAVTITFSTLVFSCSNAQQHINDSSVPSKMVMENISVEEFKQGIESNKNIVILDVRTKREVKKGKIENSINIDFYSDFKSNINTLDKNKATYVYCASGGRSSKAMNVLHDSGFKEIYNLKGGYGAWSRIVFATMK